MPMMLTSRMTTATEVSLTLDISVDESLVSVPDVTRWQAAADAALAVAQTDNLDREWRHSVSVNVVSRDDSEALNTDWRDKHKPTNVLAVPMPEMPAVPGIIPSAGELILCDDVIVAEATDQNKPVEHHYLHMIVHGCLHLLGYDHLASDEADHMESLERQALEKLGVENPY